MNDSKPTDAINDVIYQIGLATPVTNAEWGRLFADALLDTGDQEAIRYALAEAGEKYRSKHLSTTRSLAQRATQSLVSTTTSQNDAIPRQLAFEVAFEGVAPRPLALCDHDFLAQAAAYMERKLHGLQRNVNFVRRAARMTKPYPGRTVQSLIHDGMVSLEEIAEEGEKTA